jgi:cytoskeletal protein CcmA (bactofilin family)
MSAIDGHLDEDVLLRLVDEELTKDQQSLARRHLEQCSRCRWKWDALQAETGLVRAALVEVDQSAVPERIRPRLFPAELAWILSGIAAMGVVAVSAIWTRYMSPVVSGLETIGVDGTSLGATLLVRGVLWKGWTEMATVVLDGSIYLILAVVTGFVLQRVRRSLRSSPAALSLVLTVAGMLVLSISSADAAVIHFGEDTYTLAESETIDNDLIVGGPRVQILGTVRGDLIVAARLVEVSGEVQGDVLGFAEHIEISGRVGGSVRTGARLLEIEGTVARNVTAAGETIRVTESGVLEGSYTAAGRESILEGSVARDVLASAERHELRSRIGGSALLAGERLLVGPSGSLEGETKFYGGEEPDVSPDARIASPIEFEKFEHEERHGRGDWFFHGIYFFAAAFVLGAAFILISPASTESIVKTHLPAYGKSILTGFVTTVVATAAGLLLMITVVGLPLGLVTVFVLFVGLYVAQAYVGTFIGGEILGPSTTTAQTLARLALGLGLLHVAKLIPFVGFFVTVIVAFWGFGALSTWARERLA